LARRISNEYLHWRALNKHYHSVRRIRVPSRIEWDMGIYIHIPARQSASASALHLYDKFQFGKLLGEVPVCSLLTDGTNETVSCPRMLSIRRPKSFVYSN